MLLASCVSGRSRRAAPSERITMGVVGWGSMGPGNTKAFLSQRDCQVVAACDLDPAIVREGKEGLFSERWYSYVFPNADPNYYLSRYWLMREVGAVEEPLLTQMLDKADEVVIGNSVRGRVEVGEVVRDSGIRLR